MYEGLHLETDLLNAVCHFQFSGARSKRYVTRGGELIPEPDPLRFDNSVSDGLKHMALVRVRNHTGLDL